MQLSTKIILFVSISFICCGEATDKPLISKVKSTENKELINKKGLSITTRFNPPKGFERKAIANTSFGHYLRNLPLKKAGTKVKLYDGSLKTDDVYDAVVDMDIGKKDLQQCADAIMRLRGEYFYSLKAYDKISFTLTNGFKVAYTEWMKGNRVVVDGNKTWWKKLAEPSNTYKDFRAYMDLVFNYAGTLSLSKELKHKELKDVAIGDVIIQGGSPGHAVIVVDVAENETGEKVFLIAQSYMPAQDIQILKNTDNIKLSPWYSSKVKGKFITPEWVFTSEQLKFW